MSRETVRRRRAAGVCVKCGGESDGKYYCPRHADEKNERLRASWKTRYQRSPATAWCTRIVQRIRRRLKGKKRELALTAKDLVAVFPKDLQCPVFGRPFVFGKSSPWNPSVDRKDPSGDYTPDNVEVISVRANVLKNDATADELQAVVNWLRCKESCRQTPRE